MFLHGRRSYERIWERLRARNAGVLPYPHPSLELDMSECGRCKNITMAPRGRQLALPESIAKASQLLKTALLAS